MARCSRKNNPLPFLMVAIFLNFVVTIFAFGPVATEFAGVLHIRLDYYQQQDSTICKWGILGLTDLCDPYFTVAAGPPGRPVLASFESQPIDNAHKTLQFGRKIGQLANPLRFWFRDSDKLGDLLDIKIKVKDYDPLMPDDLMKQFRWSLPLANLTTGVLDSGAFVSFNAIAKPSSALLTGLRGRGDRLALEAWISCRPGRAGPACSVACTPGRPASESGGFGCELATGRRVCLPGFLDPSAGCSRRDPCATVAGLAPCAHGGECLADEASNSPVCRCPEGFTGPRCQTLLRPCSAGAVGSRACVHGLCVAAPAEVGRGAGQCACEIGYQGDLCDRDIDECRLLAPCQHNAVCVNIRGSFKCRCQPGFSGRFCQLPPMLLPPPEPKPVAASAPDTSAASSATMLTAVLLSVITVLALALLLLLWLLMRRRRKGHEQRDDGPQFAAVFTRRPAGVKPDRGAAQDGDSSSCYDSIEELPLRQAGENPYEADSADNFPNAAYAVEAPSLLPPPPPPRLSAVTPPASRCGESPKEDSHSNCYV